MVLEMRFGHSHVQRHEDLQENALGLEQTHVDTGSLKGHARLVEDEVALAFVDECGMLTNLVRHLGCEVLRHEIADRGFVEELVAQDQRIGAVALLGKLLFEPCNLDNGGLSAPRTSLERGPLSDLFAMGLHEDDIVGRESTGRLELAALGIRLD